MAKIRGTEFNDSFLQGPANESNIIFAREGDDTLFGGNFRDEMYGEAGNDYFASSPGGDVMSGGDGVDTASYAGSYDSAGNPAGVTVNLLTGTGSGGHAQGDTLSGIENLIGSAAGDTLTGNRGNNELDGHYGNDVLIGGDGSDILFGGQVNFGFTDNDTLSGGGRLETDTFRFPGQPWGNDVITDFQVGVDRLEFMGNAGWAVDSMADLNFAQVGNNTVITAKAGTITLQNVSLEQLLIHQSHDFLFV